MSRLVLLCLLVFGLKPPVSGADAHKLRVLATILPVYCFTMNVAGDLAEVENLLPANVEPHDYQFSRKDLQKLTRADLIVINGLGLENWLGKAVQNASSIHPKKVVELAAGLEAELIYPSGQPDLLSRSSRQRSNLANPHIWLDPRLVCHAVTNILEALQQADPANASGYAANAARYLDKLERLDTELRQALRPIRGASMVTYHDAFAYFARRYGLNVVGVIEPVPDFEPSLKYLVALYRSIRVNEVQAIFCDPPGPTRLAWQIGRDLHLPLAQLDTLETGRLTPTAYEEAVRNNLRVLLKHLKPDAQRASR